MYDSVLFTFALNYLTKGHQFNYLSTDQEQILGNIHLVDAWSIVGIICQGVSDVTSTNNFLINLTVIQCMFCNDVCVYVLGPGPTGCN